MAPAYPPGYIDGFPPCGGVLLKYSVQQLQRIPFPTAPAFSFESLVEIANVGNESLGSWELTFDFAHSEVISGVDGADLPVGAVLPVAGNGLILSNPDSLPVLPTAVDIGGNKENYTHTVKLNGTEIDANTTHAALPLGMNLASQGFSCDSTPLMSDNSSLMICCPSSGSQEAPASNPLPPAPPSNHSGVLITWDIMSSNKTSYVVKAQIINEQRYTSVSSDPGWALRWKWRMDEMIVDAGGFETLKQGDCSDCPACLANPNITSPYCCDPAPTLVDKSLLNGSLGAPSLAPFTNTANLTLGMARGRQYWGSSNLDFPSNFSLILPGYECDPPLATSQRSFPTDGGIRQSATAVGSYNITCGPTEEAQSEFSCCVSVSAFFNTTVAPCLSCQCGCNASTLLENGGSCSPSSAATDTQALSLLLGSSLGNKVLPFTGSQSDRCSSNCPTLVHLDIPGGGKEGWTLKAAIYNAGRQPIKGWNSVLEFSNGLGVENLQSNYSVNAVFDDAPYQNNMIITGIDYYNNWVLEQGNVQFTVLFNRSVNSVAYNLTGGSKVRISERVFPSAVFVNGAQCKMPDFLPLAKSSASALIPILQYSSAIMAVLFTILLSLEGVNR